MIAYARYIREIESEKGCLGVANVRDGFRVLIEHVALSIARFTGRQKLYTVFVI